MEETRGRKPVVQSELAKQVIAFLNEPDSEIFSISTIAELASCNKNTLAKAVKGEAPLPEKDVLNLVVLLARRGFKTKINWHVYNASGKIYLGSTHDASLAEIKVTNGHVEVVLQWTPLNTHKQREQLKKTMIFWYKHNILKDA